MKMQSPFFIPQRTQQNLGQEPNELPRTHVRGFLGAYSQF